MTALGIALGGGLGAAARYVLDAVVLARTSGPLPWGTVVVNVVGSLLVGLLLGAYETGRIGDTSSVVVATGFLGGFTTFSTASVDVAQLVLTGRWVAASTTAGGMLIVCVGAAAAGVAIAG